MLTSTDIDQISTALAKAQGEIQNATKDAKNPAFEKSASGGKYATLASIWEACRASLSKNGIAVVQSPGTDDQGAVTMTTTLCHASGQWMRNEMACKPSAGTAQQLGSVITYLRRYALAAMAGVAPDDDDDGNQASGTVTPAGSAPSKQSRTAATTPFDGKTADATPFWKRDSLDLDGDGKAPLDALGKTMLNTIAKAPSEKDLNRFIQHNDYHIERIGRDFPDMSEAISSAITKRLGDLAAG